MTAPRFLAVKNFEQRQHYRDRHPVWIKLYLSILTDIEFAALPEAAQAQLVKLWLIASGCGNRIPYDRKAIGQSVKAKGKLYLTELIASGFLYFCEQNASTAASNTLAKSYSSPRGDAPSREEEKELHPSPLPQPTATSSTTSRLTLPENGAKSLAHDAIDTAPQWGSDATPPTVPDDWRKARTTRRRGGESVPEQPQQPPTNGPVPIAAALAQLWTPTPAPPSVASSPSHEPPIPPSTSPRTP